MKKNRNVAKKVSEKSCLLGKISKITAGVKPYEKGKGTPSQTDDVLNKKPFTGFQKFDYSWLKLIRGTQINRYLLTWNGEYIKYGPWLAAPRNINAFVKPKIFIRRTDDKILSVYDNEGIIGLNSIHCLQVTNPTVSIKYLLSVLNSKLINWFFQYQNFHMVGKPLAEVKVVFIERLPIKIIEFDQQQPFIDKADTMLEKNKQLNQLLQQFTQLLQAKFPTIIINNKLQSWPSLKPNEFFKELDKQKIKLSLAEQQEWLQYFEEQKLKANNVKQIIQQTDHEIDAMVYALYGLSEAEITIVEGK